MGCLGRRRTRKVWAVEDERLEDTSDANMAWFYRVELRELSLGADSLDRRTRIAMRRMGLIKMEIYAKGPRRVLRTALTEKGLILLAEAEATKP